VTVAPTVQPSARSLTCQKPSTRPHGAGGQPPPRKREVITNFGSGLTRQSWSGDGSRQLERGNSMTKGFGPSTSFGWGSDGNVEFISASHGVHRQRCALEGCSARAMLRHRGSRWETTCTVLRPCVIATATSVAKAAARRLKDDESVGTANSLRWVRSLESPGESGPRTGW